MTVMCQPASLIHSYVNSILTNQRGCLMTSRSEESGSERFGVSNFFLIIDFNSWKLPLKENGTQGRRLLSEISDTSINN